MPKVSSELTRAANGDLIFKGFPTFRPNKTPAEVFALGAYGGTYFQPIRSGVNKRSYTSAEAIAEYPKSWFEGLNMEKQVTSSRYNSRLNRYKIKCGTTLIFWESKNWIREIDPYGWFQWYCRFFLGRRSYDDMRQIKRWESITGEGGRFRNQLIGRCARAHTTFDDESISPVIRQVLLHWAYELTESHANAYIRRKSLPKLKESTRALVPPAPLRPIDLAFAAAPVATAPPSSASRRSVSDSDESDSDGGISYASSSDSDSSASSDSDSDSSSTSSSSWSSKSSAASRKKRAKKAPAKKAGKKVPVKKAGKKASTRK